MSLRIVGGREPRTEKRIRVHATGCVLIAPVCANCGGEVDKIDGQWWHVRDLPRPAKTSNNETSAGVS